MAMSVVMGSSLFCVGSGVASTPDRPRRNAISASKGAKFFTILDTCLVACAMLPPWMPFAGPWRGLWDASGVPAPVSAAGPYRAA